VTIREQIAEVSNEALLLTEGYFDEAIIGIVERVNINRVVAYDADKIIDILMKENNILYKEALEYFDYNIVGAWMGDDSPVFIWTLTTKKTILKPTLTKFDIMDV